MGRSNLRVFAPDLGDLAAARSVRANLPNEFFILRTPDHRVFLGPQGISVREKGMAGEYFLPAAHLPKGRSAQELYAEAVTGLLQDLLHEADRRAAYQEALEELGFSHLNHE